MAEFNITSPDGKKYRVTAPDGATQDDVLKYVQDHHEATAARPPEAHTTAPGLAASATRGVAPYATGAAVGAGVGALAGGVGAIPGAAAGAGAVGLTELAGALYNPLAEKFGWPKMASPQEMTDKILDLVGERRASTGPERMTQAGVGGAAGALSGAGAARQAAETLTGPVAKGVASTLAAKPGLQAVSGATSGLAGQTAAELGAGPAGQFLASELGALAPGGAVKAASPARITPKTGARAAIDAGYVIPPIEAAEGGAKPYSLGSLASGESGKIKTAQYASVKNQEVTNRLAAQSIGLPPETPLTPKTLADVRANAGKTYQEVVAAIPEIDLARDPKFKEDVGKVGNRSIETEKLFPSTKEPPGVTALRDELLTHARGTTQEVMHYIADLRFRATQNMKTIGDAMAHRTGYAQRQAANSLEDAMERSVQEAPKYYKEKLDQALARRAEIDADMRFAQPTAGVSRTPVSPHERRLESLRDERVAAEADVHAWSERLANANAKNESNQTLVDRFRDARRLMAMSYDIEAVSNVTTGDVSARGLGSLLDKGKPLTGNLKLIADAANEFPRAFQNPAAFGGVEPLSVLDLTAAGASLVAGHPVVAAGALSRPALRHTILSPGYQKAMISPPQRISPLPALTDPGYSAIVAPQTLQQLGGP
jgi:hypothetical protein